jgi:hypothetical protein
MRAHLYLSVLSRSLCLCFLLVSPVALAQMYKAIYITPISDVPLTAVVKVDQTRIERDGTKINLKVVETIARDSHGRMYRDVWKLEPASGKPQLLTICLFEPKTKTYTIIDPLFKTFWIGTLDRRPEVMGLGFFYDPHDDGSPASQFTHGKDLGMQNVEGTPVHHVRETEPVKNGAKKQMVTREYWYSDDLHMNLASRLDDPRSVIQTMTVTQLTRKEPDAAIYELPSGYRRVDALFRLHAPPQ